MLHSSFVRADVRWSLTTADLQSQTIDLVSLDADTVHFVDSHSNEKSLPTSSIAGLQAVGSTPLQSAGAMRFLLVDGSVLLGTPASFKDDQLTMSTVYLGNVSLPLKQIARIESTTHAANKPRAASATEDVVQLANGDTVRGVVEGASKTAITVKTDAGDNDVPIDSIAAVVFASSGGAAAAQSANGYRISLDDGTKIVASAIMLKGNSVTLALPAGTSCTCDPDHLTSIDPLAGPIRWLSTMTPSENLQTPFLEPRWPARMDVAVTGNPIRAGDRVVARGIGVHSKSVLTWPLDGSYKFFRTQFAIDGDLPLADADVKILLDGKLAQEVPSLRAGQLAPITWIDITGAKSITLEVDYGAGYDVQDRVNWIEPALVREKPVPATNPSTQP